VATIGWLNQRAVPERIERAEELKRGRQSGPPLPLLRFKGHRRLQRRSRHNRRAGGIWVVRHWVKRSY
jgi:hypothetical protein